VRIRANRKRTSAVRFVHWALIVYFLVAVLHGAIPAIWRHQIENGSNDGPFRILLFTFLLLALPVFLNLLGRKFACLPELAALFYVKPEFLRVWTLRGPPQFL